MKTDKVLLQNINEVLKQDLNSGIYDNFPKLKRMLEFVKEKLVRFMVVINSEPLSPFDAKLLLDNDVIDTYVHWELVKYYDDFQKQKKSRL